MVKVHAADVACPAQLPPCDEVVNGGDAASSRPSCASVSLAAAFLRGLPVTQPHGHNLKLIAFFARGKLCILHTTSIPLHPHCMTEFPLVGRSMGVSQVRA